MTTNPSVDTDTETEQGARLLGEHHPQPGTRLTLHATDRPGEAILLRHRSTPHAGSGADIAARVTHHGGVVSEVRWDFHHRSHRPAWMAPVEDWIRARIAGAAS